MKKIVILSIFLIVFSLFTHNIRAEKSQKIYTPKEFLDVLHEIEGNLSILKYDFKCIYNNTRKSATEPKYNFNTEKAKKKRKSYFKELIESCKLYKRLVNKVPYKDKIYFGVFSVRTSESNAIRKFTIQNPYIINNTDIIDQIINNVKPETDSFFNVLEKISLAINQLEQIQTTVRIYKTQIENACSIQTLSEPSTYKKYKYKKGHLIRRSIIQTSRNIMDFISLMKTADGYLKDCEDALIKAEKLCIKGLKTDATGKEINKIIPKIWKWTDECDRITEQGQFNTKTVFFNEDKHYRKFTVALNESRASEHFTFYSPQYVDGKNILKPNNIKNIVQHILNHTVPKEIRNNKKAAIKMIKRISSGTEICLKNVSSQRAKIKTYKKYLKEEEDKILKIYDNTSSD